MRAWTSRELDELIRLRAAGTPWKLVARALGRTKKSVESAGYYHRVVVRQLRRAWLVRRIRRLARPNVADAAIARQLGCASATVGGIRRRLGIPAGCTPEEASARANAAQRAYRVFPRCLNCDVRAAKQSSIEKDGWEVVAIRTDGAKSRVVFCPACKLNPACFAALGDQLVEDSPCSC